MECPNCFAEIRRGYLHSPGGCGLVNQIRLNTHHTHYYCRCGRETTVEHSASKHHQLQNCHNDTNP